MAIFTKPTPTPPAPPPVRPATVHIAEFSHVGSQGVSCPLVPPVAEQTVAIQGKSTQSAAFSAQTNFIRIVPQLSCSVAFGVDPTASTDNLPLLAGGEYYFSVPATFKIAVILNTYRR